MSPQLGPELLIWRIRFAFTVSFGGKADNSNAPLKFAKVGVRY
jgi:hypothetical protein